MATSLEISAEYMVGRMRLGYENIAKFLACSLFEALINAKYENLLHHGRANQPADPRIDTLQYRIDQLDDQTLCDESLNRYRNLFTAYVRRMPDGTEIRTEYYRRSEVKRLKEVRTRLHNFRHHRNAIIHGHEETNLFPEDTFEFIIYIWAELANSSFETHLRHFKDVPAIGCEEMLKSIWEISADYMIRAVDELKVRDGDETYSGLSSNDFENMFELRRKMAGLQNDLKEWLKGPENIVSHLTTDILTTIDTTSAYMWMPFVSSHINPGNIPVGIYNCCVSILATPRDFRIYMDFGGYAKEQRFAYYQFLASKDYESWFGNHKSDEEMKVFDIDWYSSIFNAMPLNDWVGSNQMRITLAAEKLIIARRPVTWNRMLHGYCIDAESLSSIDSLCFNRITGYLHKIIDFYGVFSSFKPRMTFDDYVKLTPEKRKQLWKIS